MPPLGAVPEERCSILASSRCCRAARNLPQVSSHASNSSALLAAEEPQSKEISLSAKLSISLLRPSFARFSYSSTGTAYSTGRTARLQKACKSFPGGLQHAAAPLRAWSGGSTHNSSLPLQHNEQPWGQQASARRQHHADVHRERRGLELAGHIPMHAHTGMQHSGGAVQLAAFGHLIDKGCVSDVLWKKAALCVSFSSKTTKQRKPNPRHCCPGGEATEATEPQAAILPVPARKQPACAGEREEQTPRLISSAANNRWEPTFIQRAKLGNKTVPFHPISHLLINFPLNKPPSLVSTPQTKLMLQNCQKSQVVVISAVNRRGKGGRVDVTCSC